MSRDLCYIPDYIRESAKDFVKSYKKGIPESEIKGYLREANHILSNLLAEAREDEDEDEEDEDEDEDEEEEVPANNEMKEIIEKIETELKNAQVKLNQAYTYSRNHPYPGPNSGTAEIRMSSAQNRVHAIERRLSEARRGKVV